MIIDIQTIPHNEQRYETCGDWWFDKKHEVLFIRVSELNNPKYESLIALHELVEALMCEDKKISETDVTEFDKNFEMLREIFPRIIGQQEPGDMISAPYHDAHKKASQMEATLADFLNVNFEDYEKAVNNLPETKS